MSKQPNVQKHIFKILVYSATISAFIPPAVAQSFNQSFRVPTQLSTLEVKNKLGSIKVIAGETNWITVRAREKDVDSHIDAVQIEPGRVSVEVTGRGQVKLEISVPSASNLDLLCYDCEITVKRVKGTIRAVNTDGNIRLISVRSPRIEAHTTAGDIRFDGDVLPSGNYILKSFSGRVDAALSSAADFKLSATCFRGGIDPGDFRWQVHRQTDQYFEAQLGEGRASVNLWTQEGTIQIHPKP